MKQIKVSETTRLQLDWLVAKCEGLNPRFFTSNDAYDAHVLHQTLKYRDYVVVLHPSGQLSSLGQYNGYNDGVRIKNPFRPSTDWAQGGPIIEREKIDLEGLWNARGCGVRTGFEEWCATHPKNHGGLIRYTGYGPTPLIAAMRCYVASKMGDEVELPDELVQ